MSISPSSPTSRRSTGEAFDEEGRAGQTIRLLRGARPLRLVGDGEQQNTDGDIGDCQKSHLDTHDEYSCFAINAADMAKFLIGEIRKEKPGRGGSAGLFLHGLPYRQIRVSLTIV
ncbi:hypothetical protein RL4369 [Rhizobium johnstonii 3841]|uniref:Uncharacterized protein n=1 Tax=Rhizobium johnstonii (strain DSM 114642 / LMG 32736 / 3841) TaxID=216596 RepID=Q1MB29_RHIJ3|nr:hypothetical protein RL4369 [Rhizobium johnstonii 3841]